MGTNIRTIVTAFIISIICYSCNSDFLNPVNPATITSEDVWRDVNLVEMYVNAMYTERPGFNYNLYDNISDESRSNFPGSAPNQVLIGQWDEEYNPMGYWPYVAIRRANEFMAKIDDALIDENEKIRLRGEARFLRAFQYFDLVKRYGGIPVIEIPQTLEDDLLVPRNSVDDCISYILKELDLAIEELPLNVPRGRASKGAAMALKGRTLLYYASDLFNETRDITRWQSAAEASKAVMDLQKYDLYPDFRTLWLDNGAHVESIFEVQYHLPEKYHGLDALVKPVRLANGDAGQRSPLQELVDAFPMKEGKMIHETGSGYDPANPYVGRDDRFYSFIAYNGAKMKGTAGLPVHEITLEIYKGGRDYDGDPDLRIYNTLTGYYLVKAVDPDNSIYTWGYGSVQPWIELRYAEVLLNYAEAQNEFLASPDKSVYDALNKLRIRAGITRELPEGSLNKEQMRELIRNERYVELCFEGKRYWDLRRWKLAGTRLNNVRYSGVVITKHEDNTFSYEYQPVDPQPLVFEEHMYLMPIPRSEIAKNGNLEQNEGW